ncbi:interferon regulatory factor 9 [Periophthalmus magnuspinnatus]|uniref:interferon regulatory factor 9 n=1 Tax=Periophthalmus magnuspinnatus TaxID=409849 RepID=UPI00145AA06A|nr:interferon regulatory factor 9 [Periophthalmus magnuspinnatus]
MVVGKVRSTRKLRAWMVEQVNSGKYPGVVWDDEDKTMFRIPWKHAGKQDFRKDEDAAIFKAWAQYKGKLTDEELNNPASWKTRLRCALNKSPEFSEVNERAQLDISEPYKVYRLVPVNEQSLTPPEKKIRERSGRKQKRRSADQSEPELKHIKTEECSPETSLQFTEVFLPSEIPVESEETVTNHIPRPSEEMDEITLDVRIEETVPSAQTGTDSFRVVVQYLGQEVVRQQVCSSDVRIQYLRSPLCPPSSVPQGAQFPRVPLPDPGLSLGHGEELAALHTLLPFMEKGILLTSTKRGVYGKRFCQGRVFWTGPHSEQGLHKMERNTEPVLLFCKETFKQQLELFCANGGERPQCSFTLCFGEELSEAEDTSKKLIIVQIGLPWAEQQVENFESIVRSINFLQTLADQSPMREITLDLEPVD